MSNEELTIRIRQGERKYMETLWRQNAGFIHRTAYRFYVFYHARCDAAGVTLDDILLRAAGRRGRIR